MLPRIRPVALVAACSAALCAQQSLVVRQDLRDDAQTFPLRPGRESSRVWQPSRGPGVAPPADEERAAYLVPRALASRPTWAESATSPDDPFAPTARPRSPADPEPAPRLGYRYFELRLGSDDRFGPSAEGSWPVLDHVFVLGGAAYNEFVVADDYSWRAGAGVRVPIPVPGGPLDAVCSAEYEYARQSIDVGLAGLFGVRANVRDDGLRLRAGLRYQPWPRWELRAGVVHTTTFGSEWIGDVAAQFAVGRRWSLLAQAEFGDQEGVLVGARFTF